MVKSAGNGMRDWLIQRVSAVVMVLYLVGWLVLCFQQTAPFTYESWHALFAMPSMRFATLFFFLSLAAHAWIGIWTVLTDYVKSAGMRLFLQVVVLFSLFAMLMATIQILWGA